MRVIEVREVESLVRATFPAKHGFSADAELGLAPGAIVKKLKTGSVVFSKPFNFVFYGMRVNKIHYYCNSHFVGSVNQCF